MPRDRAGALIPAAAPRRQRERGRGASGTLAPKVSGATIKLRATRPNGTVTTHSTTTDAASTWRIKIPMGNADIGQVKIEAFFDGELKYGADDAVCTVPIV